jgi:hypothetical protein
VGDVNFKLLLSGIFLLAGVQALSMATLTLKLNGATVREDGTLEFRAEWDGTGKVAIESSTDLKEWTSEGLWTPNGTSFFPDTNWRGAHRFYRARDFLLIIEGTVRDLKTEEVLRDARVTITFTEPWLQADMITQTDAQGAYQFIAPRELVIQQIVVEKDGYDRLVLFRPGADPTSSKLELVLWLGAQGYRPPNDDFQNRIRLEGTNLVIRARTFAATSEPGHSFNIFFDDYFLEYPRNLWWSWTAPKDGALFIAPQLGGLIVYTGQALRDLVEVWNTYDSDDAFFVKQGVEYQIAFGTGQPADTGFSFKMVDPLPPTGARAQLGASFPARPGLDEGGAATLLIQDALLLDSASNGTSPLRFQWRKDGVEIPGATNTVFSIIEVRMEDAGAYSVQVSNEVGSVITKDIQITILPERPHLPEVMKGAWTQESPLGSRILTFTDTEFSAKWMADGNSAGAGHYRLIRDRWGGYRLTMNFSEPSPEVHDYILFFDGSWSSPPSSEATYRGSITASDGAKIEVQGTFRAIPQP